MGFFSKLFQGQLQPDSGLGVDELARRLNLTPEALHAIPIKYAELKIPKRDGTARLLHAPAAELKTLQRTLLRRVLGKLSVHPAAMGFERGHSIATNAAPHVGAAVLVKMDLRDFFTKTTEKRLAAYFKAIGWSHAASGLLLKLTAHDGGLPQGAPTSPRLSNLVNYAMDERLFNFALTLSATYTRYADDMTFSLRADNRAHVARIIQMTQEIVDDYDYHLHTAMKLRIKRRHDCMLVTGIVVNQKLALPRATRRRLRAVEHHLKTGKPATLSEAQIKGWRAFEAMIIAQRPAASA